MSTEENITVANNGDKGPSDQEQAQRKLWVGQIRGWLATIAVLVAQSSLQAALSPPGGFWSDDKDGPGGHKAGNPILADRNRRRYQVFIYLNAVTFATSLAVAIMVTSEAVLDDFLRLFMLTGFVVVDLMAMMGAYAAGTCRDMHSTAILLVIMGLVFLLVIFTLLYVHVLLRKVWDCLLYLTGYKQRDGGQTHSVRAWRELPPLVPVPVVRTP